MTTEIEYTYICEIMTLDDYYVFRKQKHVWQWKYTNEVSAKQHPLNLSGIDAIGMKKLNSWRAWSMIILSGYWIYRSLCVCGRMLSNIVWSTVQKATWERSVSSLFHQSEFGFLKRMENCFKRTKGVGFYMRARTIGFPETVREATKHYGYNDSYKFVTWLHHPVFCWTLASLIFVDCRLKYYNFSILLFIPE